MVFTRSVGGPRNIIVSADSGMTSSFLLDTSIGTGQQAQHERVAEKATNCQRCIYEFSAIQVTIILEEF